MLVEEYNSRVARSDLHGDQAQYNIVTRLEHLRQELLKPQPTDWLAKFRGKKSQRPTCSLYIWGPVGRGKTMLMDLLFGAVGGDAKRRIHFHAFMQDVHQQIHAARQSNTGQDAITRVAHGITKTARLLCLDEMQIGDIADAMIIGRLFEAMLSQGLTIVTTSNVPPSGLYKDGLNRALFLPFVGLVESEFDVVSLEGPTDYRLGRVKGYESFIAPLGVKTGKRIQEVWERLTDTIHGEPQELKVLGRMIRIPQAARDCARFSFADLCEAPLGSADYLAIAESFRTIFVENIPTLGPHRRNEAKRLVLLIDTLYDRRARLVASAETAPAGIYPSGDHSFEFARTVSRLQEMQSVSWWGGRIAET